MGFDNARNLAAIAKNMHEKGRSFLKAIVGIILEI